MSETRICLGMMVKHEVKTLAKAVESCKPFVDHVLISVDSKSEDGTLELAKEIADTVVEHEFENSETPYGSFARCRNGVIQKAQDMGFDWMVQLDGHEYVTPKGKDTFKSLIKQNPQAEVFSFDLDMNGMSVRQVRLHKLIDAIRYYGDIHNYLSGYGNEKFCDTIEFIHDRKDQPVEHVQERNEQRTRMSEMILSEKIEQNPKDSRSMFYLAQSLKENAKLEEAVELFRRYLTVSNFQAEKWNAHKYIYDCLMALGRKEEAFESITAATKEHQRAEGYVILCNFEYDKGDYNKAIEYFTKAANLQVPRYAVFISEECYTWLPHDKVSMCCHNLGRYLDAIEAAARAISQKPPEREFLRLGRNITYWCGYLRKGDS